MHRSACNRLNLDWLDSLTALQTYGQFTVAAKRLGISQSALSQRIAKLEDCLGVPLVVRCSPVCLTPSGQSLIVYSQRLRNLMKNTDEELRLLLHVKTVAPTDAALESKLVSLIKIQ